MRRCANRNPDGIRHRRPLGGAAWLAAAALLASPMPALPAPPVPGPGFPSPLSDRTTQELSTHVRTGGGSWEPALSCDTDLGATLFVPEWEVSLNGSTGGDIPPGGVDTHIELSNGSGTNVLAHVTIWTRRGAWVLNFNIPMRGGDHVLFSMRDVMNGHLNVNAATQSGPGDACTDTSFRRFINPDSSDILFSISHYADPAFNAFRQQVWDSLDDTPDDRTCSGGTSDGIYSGSFRGSLTIDVVNYCTNFSPTDMKYYVNDAIATVWPSGGSPNVLNGAAQRVPSLRSSGDPLDPLPVEIVPFASLDWSATPTFYKSFFTASDVLPGPQAGYGFVGDGRTPNTGRMGSLYLTMFPSRPGGSTRDGTARATIRPVNGTVACPSFPACQLTLNGTDSSSVTTSFGSASVNPVTGIAEWNVSVPSSAGLLTFWVASGPGCAECPSCVSNGAVLDPAPAVPWLELACTPGSAALQAPTIPGASYFWRGPGSYSSTLQNPVVSLGATGHQQEGTYFVSYTPSGGGCISLGATYLKIVDILSAPTASNDGPKCEGQPLHLSAASVEGTGVAYSWSGPNGFSSSLRSPTIASLTAAGAGTYNVTISGSGCTSAAGQTTVVVNATPATPAIATPPVAGAGSPNRQASVPNHGGSTYAWTIGNGTITGGQGTSQITFSAGTAGTPLALGVTETNPSGCTSTGSAIVTVALPESALQFYTVTPCRAIDTRSTSTLTGPYGPPSLPGVHAQRSFALAGQCGIPLDAKAVSINATVWAPVTRGDMRAFPAGSATPTVAMLNWEAGIQALANAGILQLGAGGAITVQIDGPGTVDLILDVNGYFQ